MFVMGSIVGKFSISRVRSVLCEFWNKMVGSGI